MMFSAFECFERKDLGLEEDDLSAWQDVLDRVVAGRPDDLACPFCRHRPLAVQELNDSQATRVSCSQCGKFIEGRFQP